MEATGHSQAATAPRQGMPGSLCRLLKVIAFLVPALLALSFVISGYVGWQMTHPGRDYATETPAAVGLAYADVQFPSRIGHVQLSGWYMPSGQSTRTVIIAHGYEHHRLNEVPSMPMAKLLVQHGYNVLAFDFRGCGRSGGDMVTLGQDEPGDLLGAVDYLKARAPSHNVHIGVLGFSLGATATLEAGSRDPADVRVIVSDSAFADLHSYVLDHADRWTHLPAIPFNQEIAWVTPILTGMDPAKVNALTAVRLMPHTPIFFIAGTADKTVPDSNTVHLYVTAVTRQKALWLVPGGGHTDSYKQQPRVYEQRVLAFFERYLRAA
jgi:pimeloyl-ACP methyl ester carboxylesterase